MPQTKSATNNNYSSINYNKHYGRATILKKMIQTIETSNKRKFAYKNLFKNY